MSHPTKIIPMSMRLALMSTVALLMIGLLGVYSLLSLRENLLEDRRQKTQNLVETAIATIDSFYQDQRAGKLSEADAKAAAVRVLRHVRYAGTNYFFIYGPGDTYVMLPPKPEKEGASVRENKDANGKFFAMEMIKLAQTGGGFVDYWYPKAGADVPEPKLSYAAQFEPWGWTVGTGIYIDDVDTAFYAQATKLGGIAILAMLMLGVASWLIGRSVLRQVGGEPAHAIEVMQQVAAGDLTVSLQSARPGSMLAALGEMIGALRSMMSNLGESATTLSTHAHQIASDSSRVADAAQNQVDATSNMAAAMEELTVSISHITENAEQTGNDSERAARLSGDGTTQVVNAATAMQAISATVTQATGKIQELDGRAREISTIAGVIREIAGQTNLLALNAAIEAARAGEQGRGFAVVADEVRKLAERTATATVDIERMIQSVQSETGAVVEVMGTALPQVKNGEALAHAAAQTLEQIREGAQSTLDRISEVISATREQNVASTSIAQRVESVARMVEETSAAMHSTAETADKVEVIAEHLHSLVKGFKY